MSKKQLKQIVGIILLVVASLTMVGCASTGKQFDDSKISQIRKGETTESELIQLFGPPRSRTTVITDSRANTVLTWMYSEATLDGKVFIPIVGHMMSGHEGKAKHLRVVLNSDGKVNTFAYGGGTRTSTGTQLGTQ